jgi:hypothetical protein
MIIIGLLLLIAAVIFGIDLILSNHHHFTNPAVFGHSLGLTNDAALFIVGAITGAAVLLGIALIMWGTRHKAANALAHRRERTDAKGALGERDDLAKKNTRLAKKNTRLEAQLAQERSPSEGSPTSEPNARAEDEGAERATVPGSRSGG